MTKRAVKYYEEKGLLSVDKDNNGYRNYTAQDVETLKKISVYRKLGISIKDIQSLLETGDKSILLRIYQEKVQEKVLKDSELEALKQFIDDGDADKANEALDYQTVENAIESLLPGKEWGDYFKSHFKPFLNVRLKTLEQKQALQNILEYCDETTLKVPFIMGIGAKMIGGIAQETRTADEMIAYYRDMSESEYERLKEKVWKGAKMKNGIMKYHPAFIAQRKMQKELQNKGYNDIFIPNLMVLSPTYAEYKKALDNVNDRMCGTPLFLPVPVGVNARIAVYFDYEGTSSFWKSDGDGEVPNKKKDAFLNFVKDAGLVDEDKSLKRAVLRRKRE